MIKQKNKQRTSQDQFQKFETNAQDYSMENFPLLRDFLIIPKGGLVMPYAWNNFAL